MIAQISIIIRAFCFFLMSTAVLPKMFQHAVLNKGAVKIKRTLFILGLTYTLSMLPLIWFQMSRLSDNPNPYGVDIVTIVNSFVNIVVVLAFYCIYL